MDFKTVSMKLLLIEIVKIYFYNKINIQYMYKLK